MNTAGASSVGSQTVVSALSNEQVLAQPPGFPMDPLKIIFSYLPMHDLFRKKQVCKYFLQIITEKNEPLWQVFKNTIFPEKVSLLRPFDLKRSIQENIKKAWEEPQLGLLADWVLPHASLSLKQKLCNMPVIPWKSEWDKPLNCFFERDIKSYSINALNKGKIFANFLNNFLFLFDFKFSVRALLKGTNYTSPELDHTDPELEKNDEICPNYLAFVLPEEGETFDKRTLLWLTFVRPADLKSSVKPSSEADEGEGNEDIQDDLDANWLIGDIAERDLYSDEEEGKGTSEKIDSNIKPLLCGINVREMILKRDKLTHQITIERPEHDGNYPCSQDQMANMLEDLLKEIRHL